MLKKYLISPVACLFFIAAFLLFATEAIAISFSRGTDLVSLKITPEYTTLSPSAKTIDIIAEADIKSGWHLYWDNPGDIGDPTSLSFFESPYYTEIGREHTAPEKLVYEDIITSYIYTRKVYFRSTFALKSPTTVKHLPFNLVLSYTACKESCLPEEIELGFTLPFAETAKKNPTFFNTLSLAENTFPVRLPATVSLSGELLKFKLQDRILKNCDEAEFISRHPKKSALSELPKTTVAEPDRLHVKFKKEELPPDFKGILLCSGYAYDIDAVNASAATPQKILSGSVSHASPATENATLSPASASFSAMGNNSSAPSGDSSQSLLYYLITAFIAGLILNLMPCVLPVLSLKALYLVQNRHHASPLSALSYIAGVICSFMALAGILFFLRKLGGGIGWGFQLQSPLFNTALLILFFLIFLNLIDLMPLPSSFTDTFSKLAGKQSFLTGFFAVIIACPCTGPFMGAAIGYAVTKPALTYFGIFLALSLGYAIPYALIEMFPVFFLKYIPKPGTWMITMKRILALPILLTCLWLGWIIFNQLCPSASDTSLAAQPPSVATAAETSSATEKSASDTTRTPPATAVQTPSADTDAESMWTPYTSAGVAAALAAGRPVFINFTAKWCLICLLNDKTTLSTATFRRFVAEKEIALFKADWTNRDENIGNALKAYGRNSIPLYVWYPAKKQTPVLLPQILTPDIVQTHLR